MKAGRGSPFSGVGMEIKVDAIVLRTAAYGESDKMITLFSLQQGKISAAAKGVRKAGAKLRFAAQPFCFAEYVLVKNGERCTVTGASNMDGFYALRENIEKFYAAASLVGICDAVLFDGIVNEELFLRAVNALREMCEGDEKEALISFFLKALELSGYMLDLSGCAECGAVLEGKVFFNVAEGNFTCADCAKGAGVSESTLAVLKKCAGGEFDCEKISDDGKKRALKLLYAYFRAKTDTNVKALEEYAQLLNGETTCKVDS